MGKRTQLAFGLLFWAAIIAAVYWWVPGRTSPPTVEELIYDGLTQIKALDPEVRLEAVEKIEKAAGGVIAGTWPPEPIMPALPDYVKRALGDALLAAVSDEDESVRHAAIRAVRWFPNETQAAVPELLQYLESDDPEIRLEAAYSLVRILEYADNAPPSAVLAVPILVQRLHDPNWAARESAVKALGELGQLGVATEEAVTTLLALAESDEDRYVRADVLIALGQIGQPLERISPLIAEGLDDPDEHLRFSAAIAASSLGSHGELFLSRLEVMAESDGRFVRQAAKLAIDGIRVDLALAFLVEKAGSEDEPNLEVIGSALGDADPYTRRAAAMLLGQLGRQSKQYLPELRNLRDNDPDQSVRMRAIVAILSIKMDGAIERR